MAHLLLFDVQKNATVAHSNLNFVLSVVSVEFHSSPFKFQTDCMSQDSRDTYDTSKITYSNTFGLIARKHGKIWYLKILNKSYNYISWSNVICLKLGRTTVHSIPTNNIKLGCWAAKLHMFVHETIKILKLCPCIVINT